MSTLSPEQMDAALKFARQAAATAIRNSGAHQPDTDPNQVCICIQGGVTHLEAAGESPRLQIECTAPHLPTVQHVHLIINRNAGTWQVEDSNVTWVTGLVVHHN